MKVRKIWAVVLSIAMTVILIGAVKSSDTTVVADTFGIITPTENSLVGAGHFDIKWSNATKGTVVSYKLYIDDQLVTTTQTAYEYSIFDVAKAVYDNGMMPNVTAHNYVYENILKVVDSNYSEVDYNWTNAVVKP